jgi:uncharacterized protein with GYD domain
MECIICGSTKVIKREDLPLLVKHIVCEDCGEYYIEPSFYSLHDAFGLRYGDEKLKAVDQELANLVKKYKKVYFTGNYDYPMIKNISEDFVYRDFYDIVESLRFNIDENSSGNNYGD